MVSRFKANRHKRGNVSAGHGRVGKHRKHPGGKGNAGGQHHLRVMFDRFHPGYFGKRGMRYFHKTQQKFYCPTVNVEKLASFVGEQKAEGEKIPVIDCVANGYYKVLGNGVWKTAAIVKAKFFSKLAEKKIVAAGGVCVPIA